jgi:hypothetical protein
MATADALERTHGTTKVATSDGGLTLAGMGGAVAGALAGTLLGTELGTAYPMIFGGAGTMIGSAVAAGAWWAILSTAGALFTHGTARRD